MRPRNLIAERAADCRQLALAAASRQEFELFHDLAWRAVQLGPKNDPALMYLLARAQSLSGRPNDAIVMLARIVAMGVPVDAATNDDFRRVRALPGWPELAARISPPPAAPETLPPGKPVVPERVEKSVPPVTTPPPVANAPAVAEPAVVSSALEQLRFTTPQFTPAGLAYDAVSRRFVVGDRQGRKLAVVDEFSQHVANLAGAQTSGFGEIAAIEIDARQGDLWVVSSDGSRTALHKLQLISGRLLSTYPIPEGLAPAGLADVAVAPSGVVLALDTAGHRLFRLPPHATTPEVAVTLPDSGPVSIAPAESGIVYVATASGISRVDLAARTANAVKAAKNVDGRAHAHPMARRRSRGSPESVRRHVPGSQDHCRSRRSHGDVAQGARSARLDQQSDRRDDRQRNALLPGERAGERDDRAEGHAALSGRATQTRSSASRAVRRTCSAVHPRRRSSRIPVSPSDLLNF